MASRVLLAGLLTVPLARRTRRADGRLFRVATGAARPRTWTVFVNDPIAIEQFENMKVGEPVVIAGRSA